MIVAGPNTSPVVNGIRCRMPEFDYLIFLSIGSSAAAQSSVTHPNEEDRLLMWD